MNDLSTEDLARGHRKPRRWRGTAAPHGLVSREAERALNARLALARMLYGGQSR